MTGADRTRLSRAMFELNKHETFEIGYFVPHISRKPRSKKFDHSKWIEQARGARFMLNALMNTLRR